jgi:hypothetical protein
VVDVDANVVTPTTTLDGVGRDVAGGGGVLDVG